MQPSPTTIPDQPKGRDAFLSELKFLCTGQNVDDVFVASMGLMMSAIQQRTDGKDEALLMLDITLGQMRCIVEAEYDEIAAKEKEASHHDLQ